MSCCSWSCVNTTVDRAPCRVLLGRPVACAKITFSHAPEEEQAASADLFPPLMKLRQRPLSRSLSAAGEMCLLFRSKLSGGSSPAWTNGCEDENKSSHVYRTDWNYLTPVSFNVTAEQTNVQSLCTHDYQLKDPVLVCSLSVSAPGCGVNGLSVLALVQLSCLDSVMCNATMAVLSWSCVRALRVHHSWDFVWDTQTSLSVYKILLFLNAVLHSFKGWSWCRSVIILLSTNPSVSKYPPVCGWSQTFELLPTSDYFMVVMVAVSTIWKISRANQGFVCRIRNGDVMFLYQRQKSD